MATYKMKQDQRGVRQGDVHSVLFHKDKVYDLDDTLADEFGKLDIIEPSREKPIEALPEDGRTGVDSHENWLDTDPAVLRHGELTAAEVIAKDESPYSAGMQPAAQVEGKADGELHPEKGDKAKADDADEAKAKKADDKSK